MIKPEKYMDLDKSVLMIASLILKRLFQDKVIKMDSLFSLIEEKIGDGIHENFLAALTMLHALDKIDYLEKNDTISLKRYTNEIK